MESAVYKGLTNCLCIILFLTFAAVSVVCGLLLAHIPGVQPFSFLALDCPSNISLPAINTNR